MTEFDETFSDPSGRAIGVFATSDQANSTREALISSGFAPNQIHFLQGPEGARQIDTSRKWFADTAEEVALFRQRLESGWACISVPVSDRAVLKTVHDIFHDHGARFMTHFGTWTTETEIF